MKKEKLTKEQAQKLKDFTAIQEIEEKMNTVQDEVSMRQSKYIEARNMYNGSEDTFWPGQNKAPGKFKSVFNYFKVITDKFTSMLSNPLYDFEAKMEDPKDKIEREAAEKREKFIHRVYDDNDWPVQFNRGAKNGSMMGDTFFKIWLTGKGKDAEIKLKSINIPDNVYIGFKTNDYDEMEWLAYKNKMSTAQVHEKYGIMIEARVNDDIEGVPSNNQPMVNVIDYWDDKQHIVYAGNQMLQKPEKNTYGFIPFVFIPNDETPGTPFGTNDLDVVKDAVLDYGYMLCDQGDLLKSFVNPKIKMKNMPRIPKNYFNNTGGNNAQVFGLRDKQDMEYLQWGGNIWPMREHLGALLENIFRLSCLPAVAFGEQIGSVITGFGLSIQYHATLQKVSNKRTRWDSGLRMINSYILRLAEKIDPEAKAFVKGQYDTKIIWPEVLPKDSDKHVMNTINKLNAGVYSKESSMKDMGIQAPSDEKEMIAQENTDERLDAQKALAYVQAIRELDMLQKEMSGQVPQGQEGNANTPEQQGTAQQPSMAPEDNQMEAAGLPMTQAGMEGNMAQTGAMQTTESPNSNKQI